MSTGWRDASQCLLDLDGDATRPRAARRAGSGGAAAAAPRRRRPAAQAAWPLSCRHRFILREARPAEAGQTAEVVQLQHAAGGEHLEPLLRERLAAVGEVVDRARCEPSAKRRCMVAVSRVGAVHRRRDVARRSGAPARKRSRSTKWQASPTMRPPPTARSCVQCSAGIAPALTVITNALRPRHRREQRLHLQHLRREAAVEADHEQPASSLRSRAAASIAARARRCVRQSGFSTNTCLPAASAAQHAGGVAVVARGDRRPRRCRGSASSAVAVGGGVARSRTCVPACTPLTPPLDATRRAAVRRRP